MSISLFDLHCDTAYALLNNGVGEILSLRDNDLHIDLKRTLGFQKYAQCFACFTSIEDPLCSRLGCDTVFEMEYDAICKQVDFNSDMIEFAHSVDDIQRNLNNGKFSAILTLEGTAGFNNDPGRLDDLYEKGFRITTLGWNEDNCLTGSHKSGNGLSIRGREYVETAQRLGMIIDVSHISDRAFWDIINITNAPIIASHSNSRKVHPVTRNLTDEMFLAICSVNGVVGLNLYSDFLGANPDLDTVCDHIFHFLELDPDGKHISLGGDLDGCASLPQGFTGVDSYHILAQYMYDRGVSNDLISNLFWNNAIEVFKRCCT